MPSSGRNGQVIRQWRILRALSVCRRGVTVGELSRVHGVHWRTIARDLEALQASGFPLVDVEQEDGPPRWRCVSWTTIARNDDSSRTEGSAAAL